MERRLTPIEVQEWQASVGDELERQAQMRKDIETERVALQENMPMSKILWEAKQVGK